MAKIYNEVVIDMNPESPTFEETLHEDSYEYSGDMMRLMPNGGGMDDPVYTMDFDIDLDLSHLRPEGMTEEEWKAKLESDADKRSRDYGMESLSKEQFFDPVTGEPLPIDDIVKLMLLHKPMPEGHEGGIEDWKKIIKARVEDFLPKLQEIDPTKEKFLTEDEKASLKKADLYGKEADIAHRKAGDVYALGKKEVGRQEEALREQYGLGVGAAERGLGAAEDVYGAAGEAYTLGRSAATRGLESGLGKMQQQAGQLGAQGRSAYGGMGGGMRGAIGAKATMAKGLEQTYDVFSDKQTALKGAMGRAESAYGRAGEAYTDERTRLSGVQKRGLGAAEDERRRLETDFGIAGEQFGIAGEREQAMRDAAALTKEKGQYGLEEGVAGEFESGLGSFLGGFKQGGRVPTFSEILSRIPDAGGS